MSSGPLAGKVLKSSSFQSLYKHFIAATSKHRLPVTEANLLADPPVPFET